MIKDHITPQEVVDFLNELLELDPMGINALFNFRTFCNNAIADHATVQVGLVSDNIWTVGFVGILNGIFGCDTHQWGHIAANYGDNGIEKFTLLTDEYIDLMVKKKKEKNNE